MTETENRMTLRLRILERCLQLKDEKLTALMIEAGWIQPFELNLGAGITAKGFNFPPEETI